MIPETLQDATVERLLAALRDTAREAENVVGSLPGQAPTVAQNSYLSWAETAEAQLRTAFTLPAVTDLLWTERYWAVRRSTRETPRLIPSIWAELQDRAALLRAIEAWVEAQRRRWSSPVAPLIVPDTNVFLAPGEVWLETDWQKVAESTIPVRLVIPIVVVHELDRLKRTGNNTARSGARAALRWLTSHFSFGTLEEKVAIHQGSENTVEVFVDDGAARRDDADGEIIDFTRTLRQLAGVGTSLATFDLGMRLRAALRGVTAVQLAEPAE